MQETEFEIDRDAVRRYFMTVMMLGYVGTSTALMYLMMLGPIITVISEGTNIGLLVFAFTVIAGISCIIFACCFTYGRWFYPKKASSLRYRLVGSVLRADDGVFFLSRKSIPLERITDVVLAQGPLLRFFNIWTMQIKTVGSPMPEATLYGVREPENIREMILARRRNACCEKSENA